MYQMRCAKKTWIWGQILFALEAVVFLVAFLIVSSCIMMSGKGVWQMRFSNAVTYYSSTVPERTGDYILQPIKSAVRKYSLNLVNKDSAIVLSKLKDRAGVIGACMLARKSMFES